MYPLQRSVGQERFNPVESVFPNAIIVEFVKKTTVRHLVERFSEIEQNDVNLVTHSKLDVNLVDCDYKL